MALKAWVKKVVKSKLMAAMMLMLIKFNFVVKRIALTAIELKSKNQAIVHRKVTVGLKGA